MQFLQQLKNRMGSSDRLLARGTSIAFAGVVINMAMGLLITVFKARVLTQEELGMLVAATSIAVTAFFLSNGFSITMVRFGSLFHGQDEKGKIKSVTLAIYRLAIPIIIFLLILLNVSAPFIVSLLKKSSDFVPLLRILSFGAFFHCLLLLNVGLLKSKYLIKYEYIALISQMGLIGLIALVFIWAENLVLVFAIAYPVAALTMFIYTCVIVRREFGYVFDRSVPAVPHGERPYHFAMFSSITTSLSKFREEINTILIWFFMVEADVALYNVAFKVAFLPLVLTPAVNAIFTPMVGNMFGKGDIKGIRRLHIKVSGLVAGFSLALLLIYVVGAKYILLIFGEEYVPARYALLLMALANVAAALAGPMGFAISMMGRPQINTFNSLVLLILMVGLCYYLIPVYGVNGAAVAYAISNSMICLLCLVETTWLYRVEIRRQAAA